MLLARATDGFSRNQPPATAATVAAAPPATTVRDG